MFKDDLECLECGEPLTEDENEFNIKPVYWDGENPLCKDCWEDLVGYDDGITDEDYEDDEEEDEDY